MLATQNRLKSQLNDAIEQAQSVLDNSDGMVADDSVRMALQQAIDSARNLANGTNLKENDVTAAVDALNAAKDAVQQAMDQYQEASSTPNTVTNNTNIGTNGGSNGGAANSPDNTAGGAAAGGAAGGSAGGAANAGDAGGDASAGGDAGDASDGDAAAQNLETRRSRLKPYGQSYMAIRPVFRGISAVSTNQWSSVRIVTSPPYCCAI